VRVVIFLVWLAIGLNISPSIYASGVAGPARWVTFITYDSGVCYKNIQANLYSCARIVTLLDQQTLVTIHTRGYPSIFFISETGYVLQITGEKTFTLGLGPWSVLSVPKQNYTIWVYLEIEQVGREL
jgi:hypothetical protein